MRYEIYDLKSLLPEFEICGYRFVREHDYDEKVINLSQSSVVTRDVDTKAWVETTKEKQGNRQHTYTAFWDKSEEEPDAKLYRDGKLILDILLLWSIWDNNYPCTGEEALYQQVYYFNDNFFNTHRRLIYMIEIALRNIRDKSDAKNKKLFPALFLIQQSNIALKWESKILFLSPCIDLVSKSFNSNLDYIYNEGEINAIEELKTELNRCLDRTDLTENIINNAINPFKNKINTLGSPTAVDYLQNWVKCTLDISDQNDKKVVKEHCVVFNQFRNSIVHYAGLPSRNIKLRLFTNKTYRVSKDNNEETCIRVGIDYFNIFSHIIHIWVAKIFGIDKSKFFIDIKEEIMDFLRYGIWREINIFEEDFAFDVCNEGEK